MSNPNHCESSYHAIVIPANAGIHVNDRKMDSRVRGNDGGVLRRQFLVGFLGVLALGAMSYFFVDRQVVLWLSAHHSQTWPVVKILHPFAEFPGWFVTYFVFLSYLYLGIRMLVGSLTSGERTYAFFLTVLVIAYFGVNTPLKLFFGRPWPDTFYGNPSFLKNGLYGFYLGLTHRLFMSFPSGHSLDVSVLATFAWYYARPLRFWCLAYGVFVVAMMIVQYFHFVSDCLAGIFLGYWTVRMIKFFLDQKTQ